MVAALAAAAGVVVAAMGIPIAVDRAFFSVETQVCRPQATQSSRPKLQRILDDVVGGPSKLAPGAAAYVSGPHGGWLGAAGVADTSTCARMPVDARMRLESVTKIYTATLILQLAQEGRLRVDDTVERWLPGLLPYGNRITIEQLLAMTPQRATARLVGVLFIVATVTSIVGGSLLLPLDDSDYLTTVAEHEGQIILGVLLEFVLALSVIGIAALLLPVLRPHGEGMAVGYVAVRTVEATFILIASTTALLVLALSQDWGNAGGVGVEPVGSALLSAREWALFVGTLIVFGVSAVILNALLSRSRLVPVWVSLLGLVGGILLLTSAVVEMFAYGVDAPVAVQLVGAAPIALQEMILAVLLIWKGFAAPPAG